MPENKISILCTRVLDQHIINRAEANGIHITTLPFIEIQLREDELFSQQVKQLALQKINVVFTSFFLVIRRPPRFTLFPDPTRRAVYDQNRWAAARFGPRAT